MKQAQGWGAAQGLGQHWRCASQQQQAASGKAADTQLPSCTASSAGHVAQPMRPLGPASSWKGHQPAKAHIQPAQHNVSQLITCTCTCTHPTLPAPPDILPLILPPPPPLRRHLPPAEHLHPQGQDPQEPQVRSDQAHGGARRLHRGGARQDRAPRRGPRCRGRRGRVSSCCSRGEGPAKAAAQLGGSPSQLGCSAWLARRMPGTGSSLWRGAGSAAVPAGVVPARRRVCVLVALA